MYEQLSTPAWMLIQALRYALPRQTYTVSDTADQIIHQWPNLQADTRKVIIRDLEAHLEVELKRDPNQMDTKTWFRTLETLKSLDNPPVPTEDAPWSERVPVNCVWLQLQHRTRSDHQVTLFRGDLTSEYWFTNVRESGDTLNWLATEIYPDSQWILATTVQAAEPNRKITTVTGFTKP